jgi:hypothetical protein
MSRRISLTLAVESVAVTLDPRASTALLRAERLALMERIGGRLLARDADASANSFYALVGGRKADALEAFRAAKAAAVGLEVGSALASAERRRSRPGPAGREVALDSKDGCHAR